MGKKTMAAMAAELLADERLLFSTLDRVMSEQPLLTCHGMGWNDRNVRGYTYHVPLDAATDEGGEYIKQRQELPQADNEMRLALYYLLGCARTKTVNSRGSYATKHLAESDHGFVADNEENYRYFYVSNGVMIAAVLMCEGEIVEQTRGMSRGGVNWDFRISKWRDARNRTKGQLQAEAARSRPCVPSQRRWKSSCR